MYNNLLKFAKLVVRRSGAGGRSGTEAALAADWHVWVFDVLTSDGMVGGHGALLGTVVYRSSES